MKEICYSIFELSKFTEVRPKNLRAINDVPKTKRGSSIL